MTRLLEILTLIFLGLSCNSTIQKEKVIPLANVDLLLHCDSCVVLMEDDERQEFFNVFKDSIITANFLNHLDAMDSNPQISFDIFKRGLDRPEMIVLIIQDGPGLINEESKDLVHKSVIEKMNLYNEHDEGFVYEITKDKLTYNSFDKQVEFTVKCTNNESTFYINSLLYNLKGRLIFLNSYSSRDYNLIDLKSKIKTTHNED